MRKTTINKKAGGARPRTTRDRELLKDGDRYLGLGMRSHAKMSYLQLVRKSSLQEQLAFFDKLENYLLNLRDGQIYSAIKKCEKYAQLMAFLHERMRNTAKLDAVIDERQKFQVEVDLPADWEDDGLAQELKRIKDGN